MRLVVRTTEPLRQGPGPTAWTASWSGELGVERAAGEVAWLGIVLRSSSWGDYASTYSSCDEVELYAGWRLRVRANFWELFVGDSWTVSGCWESEDGATWRKIEPFEPTGAPIDVLRTPPGTERVVA